jgi:sigma-B regulation protein RsbU (phosphoserine phosphatase)
LLTEINLALIANLKSSTTTIFASAFYLVIDVATGRMLCANAGHPSPFWLRRDVGKSQLLQASANGRGPALGLMSEAEYPSHRYALNPADAVLLFTDGLYEVEGTDGSQFGLARLETEVQNRIRQPCAELVKDLVAEAQKLSPNGDFTDDVCLVGVEAVEAVIGRTWDRPARQPDSSPVEADPGKL